MLYLVMFVFMYLLVMTAVVAAALFIIGGILWALIEICSRIFGGTYDGK